MAKSMTLSLCHLYPDLMDTYGDLGNIKTITKRCKNRGITVTYSPLTINDKLSTSFDFYFFGGGQDQAQNIISKDLAKKGGFLKKEVDDGAVVLSICGGYQLLQNYFKTSEEKIITGIGIFNAYTVASSFRMMQNLIVKTNPTFFSQMKNIYPTTINTLVGFENHSGKTYLESDSISIGKVLTGSGNNGEDKLEGAVYKNAFGTYMHGSLLPKNPHFADFLITKALERNYGNVKLKPLDDWLEWSAHEQTLKRIRTQS